MNILIATPFFYPSTGGLETVTDTLAEGLASLGHRVIVVTPTMLAGEKLVKNYRVERNPNFFSLLKLVKDCDVFIHNTISLRVLLPLLLFWRPWIVVHHMLLPSGSLKFNVLGLLKKHLARLSKSVAVSDFMSRHYGGHAVVIPNPLSKEYFDFVPKVPAHRDIVFVGRLIPEKGCDWLLRALAKLSEDGSKFNLTVIGDGPQRAELMSLSRSLGLTNQVDFLGFKHGEALREFVSAHRVIAVPSVWPEPFGVVALEGLACGCSVVATRVGGLPDAVGDCGVLVPPNDVEALANALRTALINSNQADLVRAHLERHRPRAIAERYLKLIKDEWGVE